MRLALHWRSLGRADIGLEALLDLAATAGFVGVQASRRQIDEYMQRRPNSRLVKLVAAAGLCQTATWLGFDLDGSEPEFLTHCEHMEGFRHRVRALAGFGVGEPVALVRAPAGACDGGASSQDWVRRARLVARLLGQSDLALLLDPADPSPDVPAPIRPLPAPRQGPDLERLVTWVRACGLPNVGLVVDAWRWPHLGAAAALDLLAGLRLLGRMADVPQRCPEAPAPVPRLPPGRGALDLTAYVRRLRALGYDGYWEVEAALPTGGQAEAAARCRRAGERVLLDAVRF